MEKNIFSNDHHDSTSTDDYERSNAVTRKPLWSNTVLRNHRRPRGNSSQDEKFRGRRESSSLSSFSEYRNLARPMTLNFKRTLVKDSRDLSGSNALGVKSSSSSDEKRGREKLKNLSKRTYQRFPFSKNSVNGDISSVNGSRISIRKSKSDMQFGHSSSVTKPRYSQTKIRNYERRQTFQTSSSRSSSSSCSRSTSRSRIFQNFSSKETPSSDILVKEVAQNKLLKSRTLEELSKKESTADDDKVFLKLEKLENSAVHSDTNDFLQRLDLLLSRVVDQEKDKIKCEEVATEAELKKEITQKDYVTTAHKKYIERHKNCFGITNKSKLCSSKASVSSKLLSCRWYQPPRLRKKVRKREPVSHDKYKGDHFEAESDSTDGRHESDCSEEDFVNRNTTKQELKTEETEISNGNENNDYVPVYHKETSNVSRKKEDNTIDSGEVSVDSAYAGSREATPIDVCRNKKIISGAIVGLPSSKERFRPPSCNADNNDNLLSIRHHVLCEIRDCRLYSDSDIQDILCKYRTMYLEAHGEGLEKVLNKVATDLGVKPTPEDYFAQILANANVRNPHGFHMPTKLTKRTPSLDTKECIRGLTHNLPTTLRSLSLVKRSTPSPCGVPGSQKMPRSLTPQMRDFRTLLLKEKEDEIWAKEALKELDDKLVDAARCETNVLRDHSGSESGQFPKQLEELCKQFDISIK